MVLVKLIGKLEEITWLSWLIVVVLGVYIFVISSLIFPVSDASGFDIKPIVYHIGVFFLFGFFLMVALIKGERKRFFVSAILLSVLYAVSDEVHQIFVPGRGASLGDVVLDGVGIVFAFMIYSISLRYRKLNGLG